MLCYELARRSMSVLRQPLYCKEERKARPEMERTNSSIPLKRVSDQSLVAKYLVSTASSSVLDLHLVYLGEGVFSVFYGSENIEDLITPSGNESHIIAEQSHGRMSVSIQVEKV